jgi:hypothetical protein
MGKSTKFKKGEYAIQINAPMDNCLVKILDKGSVKDGFYRHEHLGGGGKDFIGQSQMGVVHGKFLRRATKKEILIHAVRKEY